MWAVGGIVFLCPSITLQSWRLSGMKWPDHLMVQLAGNVKCLLDGAGPKWSSFHYFIHSAILFSGKGLLFPRSVLRRNVMIPRRAVGAFSRVQFLCLLRLHHTQRSVQRMESAPRWRQALVSFLRLVGWFRGWAGDPTQKVGSPQRNMLFLSRIPTA